MADVHTAAVRSRNMAAIRAKNTRPELALRRALFSLGFRYRLHAKHLPGRPDLVLAKHRAVIFVHGCFFHMHGCPAFRWPATDAVKWRTKIEGNRLRDQRAHNSLLEQGWRVLTVWECAQRGPGRLDPASMRRAVARWLRSSKKTGEIAGLRVSVLSLLSKRHGIVQQVLNWAVERCTASVDALS